MDRYCDMTDEAVVELAKKGIEPAFAEILDRYKKTVRIKARMYYIEGGDPDDIIQEGMIGLFKAVRDYDREKAGSASFNTFANLCIVRQISSAIKIASSKKNSPLNTSVPIPESEEPDSAEHAESPETILIDREAAELMKSRLKCRLSHFENIVLEMLLKDMNYGEIAESLGVDKKSADNAVQRIKRKMKVLKNE